MRPRRLHPAPVSRSAFAGFCFPPDVIVLAVRWYLRFSLSYRDVEELLAGRAVALRLPSDRPVRADHRRVVSPHRNAGAARRFSQQAIRSTRVTPVEVVTDKAATYPIVLEELLPAALHRTDRYANNHIEAGPIMAG